MSYKDEAQSVTGVGLEKFPGFLLLRPTSGFHAYMPRGKQGKTVLRVVPEVDDKGAVVPWRLSSAPCDFSGWMRVEKLVRLAGISEKFTVFCRVAGKDLRFQGPVERFVSGLRNRIKKRLVPPEWITWVAPQGPLPNVEMSGVLQVIMLECGGRICKSAAGRPGDYPALLVVPKSGRSAIEVLCNAGVQGYTGLPNDFNSRYVGGSICDPATGRSMIMDYHEAGEGRLPGYTVSLSSNVIKLSPEFVVKNRKPWEEVLNFLSIEEQMTLLCNHFPLEAVAMIFDHGEWASLLPKNAKGTWDKASAGTPAVQTPTISVAEFAVESAPVVQQPVTQAPPSVTVADTAAEAEVEAFTAPEPVDPGSDLPSFDVGAEGETAVTSPLAAPAFPPVGAAPAAGAVKLTVEQERVESIRRQVAQVQQFLHKDERK